MMAQELVLIPKEEYEALLTEPQKTIEEKTDREAAPLHKNDDRSASNNKQMLKITPTAEKKVKLKKAVKKSPQKGNGKRYAKKTLKEFLKLPSLSKNRTKIETSSRQNEKSVKRKWMRYKY